MISSLLRIDTVGVPVAVSSLHLLAAGAQHPTPSAASETDSDLARARTGPYHQELSGAVAGLAPGESSPLMSAPVIAAGQSPSQEVKLLENGISGAVAETDGDVDKREREHKKRSKNWTRPETLKLIRLRTDLEPRFAKSGRKTELWDEIADALQKERITRDAQQCRDKWEKLTAGYKEVRDGVKDREDNPFYDELHPLLSGKSIKRERERDKDCYPRDKEGLGKDAARDTPRDEPGREIEKDVDVNGTSKDDTKDDDDEDTEERAPAKKKKKGVKYVTVTDIAAVQQLLDSVILRQQRFFRDLLDSMERKEQLREQMRQEKEDKWRAEERAQRGIFNNAMLVLTQKLVGDRLGQPTGPAIGVPAVSSPEGPQAPKRRSKNWKRGEVLQLIKLRGEMESRFAKSARRAALWDELAELLGVQGIKRDGKQCREKWDKLMAEYKDVTDGKREQGESSYFAELTAVIGRPAEAN